MAQLLDRVRLVERLKAEKARASKYGKKEKVAYVDASDSNQDFNINWSLSKYVKLISLNYNQDLHLYVNC